MSLPPTRRLYLDDPFTTAFTAKVVATGTREGRAFVELEATHFYPEAGGQLPDRGRLGGRAVVDVQEDGERVLHFLDGPEAGLAPGTAVAAEIDRATRLDHMQQHTGQHMLSAALLELFRIPTLSFHMGAEGSTIDLDAAELTAAQLEAVEDRVNLLIQEDRPVKVLYPDEAGLAALKLRKEPAVTGRLRVIEVEGFDHSACGGTHCTRTGQLGVLHLAHWERVRQKARLHFLVGMRAVRDHRIQNGRLAALSAMLTTGAADLATRVGELSARARDAEKALAEARAELWSRAAVELLPGATRHGALRLVLVHAEKEPLERRTLAIRLAQEPDVVAAFSTPAGDLTLGAGPATGVDAGKVFAALVKTLGGKGGGQKTLAQGRLDPARIGELPALLKTLLPA